MKTSNQLPVDTTFNLQRGLSVFDPLTGKLFQVTVEALKNLLGLVSGSAYVGAAEATTNPGTPTGPVFYTAGAAGTYTHFLDASSNPIVVGPTDGLAILSYNGSSWTKQAAALDLTGYTQNTAFTPVKNIAERLDVVVFTDTSGNFFLQDAAGHVGLMFNADLGLRTKKVVIDQLNDVLLKSNANFMLAIADANDNLGFGVTTAGQLLTKSIKVKELVITESMQLPPGYSVEKAVPFVWGAPDQILFAISYGQSNSLGAGGGSPYTTTQKYDSLMFQGGTKVLAGGNYSSLVPLIETGVETPLSGIFEQFIDEVAEQNFLGFDKKGFQFLGNCPGQGGTPIEDLDKGSTPYANLIDNVEKAVFLATQQGKSVSIPFILWTQGEQNVGNTTYQDYKDLLAQLITDLNTDIKAITGQRNNISLIGYQLNWSVQTGATTIDQEGISKALLDMGLEHPLFVCATPTYHYDYNFDDKIHFQPFYRKVYGCFLGMAAKKLVIDGIKFKPLHPISLIVSGNNLTVKYHVPVPPLVFDTTLVTDPGNYGFKILNSSSTPLTFTVTIVSDNTLLFACSASPAGGKFIYAKAVDAAGYTTGGGYRLANRGCLRDSQGTLKKLDGYPLHNWAVASSLNIT